jgi:hypothetical protein
MTKTRCLLRDTTIANNDKTMSDSELVIYKRPDLTVEQMGQYRKELLNNAQAILALSVIVGKIREDKKPEHGFNMDFAKRIPRNVIPTVKKVLNSEVFRNKYLRAETWMLSFMFSSEYTGDIVATKLSFATLFGIPNREFKQMVQSLNHISENNHVT